MTTAVYRTIELTNYTNGGGDVWVGSVTGVPLWDLPRITFAQEFPSPPTVMAKFYFDDDTGSPLTGQPLSVGAVDVTGFTPSSKLRQSVIGTVQTPSDIKEISTRAFTDIYDASGSTSSINPDQLFGLVTYEGYPYFFMSNTNSPVDNCSSFRQFSRINADQSNRAMQFGPRTGDLCMSVGSSVGRYRRGNSPYTAYYRLDVNIRYLDPYYGRSSTTNANFTVIPSVADTYDVIVTGNGRMKIYGFESGDLRRWDSYNSIIPTNSGAKTNLSTVGITGFVNWNAFDNVSAVYNPITKGTHVVAPATFDTYGGIVAYYEDTSPITLFMGAKSGAQYTNISMALVNGHFPALSCRGSPGENLMYVYASAYSGTVWTWQNEITVNTFDNSVRQTRLIVLNNRPVIICTVILAANNNDLYTVVANNEFGTSWGTPTLIKTGVSFFDAKVINGKGIVTCACAISNSTISVGSRGNNIIVMELVMGTVTYTAKYIQ